MTVWVDEANDADAELDAELESMTTRSRLIFERLRKNALERTAPDGTTHDDFTKVLKESMREGEFALSAMLQLGGGIQTAALEWLNSEKGPGYQGVTAAVLIKNVGGEQVPYCAKVTRVASPRARKGMAKATVNGKLVTVNVRGYARIKPGETKAVPIGKAVTLLMNHSAAAYEPAMRGMRSGPLSNVLREVGGQVSELGGETVTWNLESTPPEPPTSKAAPRRPRSEEP